MCHVYLCLLVYGGAVLPLVHSVIDIFCTDTLFVAFTLFRFLFNIICVSRFNRLWGLCISKPHQSHYFLER